MSVFPRVLAVFLGFSVLPGAFAQIGDSDFGPGAQELILDLRNQQLLKREDFYSRLAEVEEVIVGERHNDQAIQDAQAALFAGYAKARGEKVTFAWEFWNRSEQAKLDEAYARYRSDEMDGTLFLKAVFSESNPQLTYLPLMEAVKEAGADVLATNLTRAEKAPVVRGKFDEMDRALIPAGFSMGSGHYYTRFAEAMGAGGHGAAVYNYFVAQCLTDDVIAHNFATNRSTRSAFLVIGDFHTRYFDGVWSRIEMRSGAKKRVLIQVSRFDDEQDWGSILAHERYGLAADYVIFVK
jgi:uncharacterized iron-regulated protein